MVNVTFTGAVPLGGLAVRVISDATGAVGGANTVGITAVSLGTGEGVSATARVGAADGVTVGMDAAPHADRASSTMQSTLPSFHTGREITGWR